METLPRTPRWVDRKTENLKRVFLLGKAGEDFVKKCLFQADINLVK